MARLLASFLSHRSVFSSWFPFLLHFRDLRLATQRAEKVSERQEEKIILQIIKLKLDA
jgi:hypothetical protein